MRHDDKRVVIATSIELVARIRAKVIIPNTSSSRNRLTEEAFSHASIDIIHALTKRGLLNF